MPIVQFQAGETLRSSVLAVLQRLLQAVPVLTRWVPKRCYRRGKERRQDEHEKTRHRWTDGANGIVTFYCSRWMKRRRLRALFPQNSQTILSQKKLPRPARDMVSTWSRRKCWQFRVFRRICRDLRGTSFGDVIDVFPERRGEIAVMPKYRKTVPYRMQFGHGLLEFYFESRKRHERSPACADFRRDWASVALRGRITPPPLLIRIGLQVTALSTITCRWSKHLTRGACFIMSQYS